MIVQAKRKENKMSKVIRVSRDSMKEGVKIAENGKLICERDESRKCTDSRDDCD